MSSAPDYERPGVATGTRLGQRQGRELLRGPGVHRVDAREPAPVTPYHPAAAVLASFHPAT